MHAVRYQDTAVTTADRLEWIAPRTDLYAHVPIGKIIGLHPYAPAPDSYFWKLCDGTGTLGENFVGHDTDPIPNLTDGRFLMGGTAYGIGGSNTLLDHVHSCGNQSADHSHTTSIGTLTSSGESTTHTHTSYQIDGGASYTFGEQVVCGARYLGAGGGQSVSHSHTVSIGSPTSGGASANHNHSIGSGSDVTATESRPRYFTVIYYIKVN